MVVLSGAPHPIAAQLWINFNLDAQISAGNTNYIGYMGPNAAAEQYIDDAIKGDPRLNPPQAVIDKLVELIYLRPPTSTSTRSAGTRSGPRWRRRRLRPRPPRRPSSPPTSTAGRRPLSERIAGLVFVAPGVVWLAIFFLAPLAIILVVSLGSRDAANHITLAHPSLDNYLRATRPEYLPAFANSLRYAGSRRSCRS